MLSSEELQLRVNRLKQTMYAVAESEGTLLHAFNVIAIYEKMRGARTKLERGIAFLALTATTGPLMGLLGTVMGMIATFILLKLTDALVGVRVEGEDETLGLDLSQHGEEGYNLDADLGTSATIRSGSAHGAFVTAPAGD